MRRLLLLGLAWAATAGAAPRTDLDSIAVLRRDGRTEAATDWLRQRLTAHPGDAEARALLGELRLEAGAEKEAIRLWLEAAATTPVDVQRVRALSARLQEIGRDADALAVLEAAPAGPAGADPFAWQRAELCLRLGRWADAVEAHRALLRQEPQRRTLVQGRVALLARTPDGAVAAGRYLDALEAALGRTAGPAGVPLAHLLSACALETGAPQRGLAALRAVLGRGADADVAIALYEFASGCEARGWTDPAGQAYALYARHAGDPAGREHSLLKQAHLRAVQGDARGAVDLYRLVADGAGPEAIPARLAIAGLLADDLGDPAAALATLAGLEARLAAGDLRRRLWSQRADCHVRLDDLDAAAAALRHLAAEPEGLAEADFGLAQLDFYRARFDSAAARADSLVRRDPAQPLANDALELLLLVDAFGDHPDGLALLARARLRLRQGRAAEADSLWQRLAAGAAGGLRHTAWLEQAAALEGAASERALDLYDRVAADTPEERHAVGAALGRARVLEAQGRADEALRTCEAALLAAPGDPRAPDLRRHIERLRAQLGGISG